MYFLLFVAEASGANNEVRQSVSMGAIAGGWLLMVKNGWLMVVKNGW